MTGDHNREDTAARVTQILVEHLAVEQTEVQADTLLVPADYNWGTRAPPAPPEHRGRPDLGADSLDLVELVMAIEEDLDIDIPDDAAEPLGRATVSQLIDFVHARREEAR